MSRRTSRIVIVHGMRSRGSSRPSPQAASDVRAAKDRAAYAERERERLQERRDALGDDEAADRERIDKLTGEIATLEADAKAGAERTEADEARVTEAASQLAELDREAARIRDAHDGAKREALDALGKMATLENEATTYITEHKQAVARLVRMAEQQAALASRAAQVETEARELYALTASLDERTRSHAEAIEAAEGKRAEFAQAAEDAQTRRNELGERKAERRARLEVLERLHEEREGMDGGARRILDAIASTDADDDGARDGVFGLLADRLRPDPARAADLDRLLDHAAGALLVRSTQDAHRWIAWLRDHGEGERARFVCLDLVAGNPSTSDAREDLSPAVLGCDADLAALVRSLVADIDAVGTLEDGIARHRATGHAIVTERGERISARGEIVGGRARAALGLVERMAEMRALRDTLRTLEDEHAKACRAVRAAEESEREAEETARRLRRTLQEAVEDRQRRGEALARVEKRAHARRADGRAARARVQRAHVRARSRTVLCSTMCGVVSARSTKSAAPSRSAPKKRRAATPPSKDAVAKRPIDA